MIYAVLEDGVQTTCLYFAPFLLHHLLDIHDNDLKLNILFFEQNSQRLVCFICHVNINREVGLVWRLPEIKLQDHEISTPYSMV